MGGGEDVASVVRGSTEAVVRDLGDLLIATARYVPMGRTDRHSHCRPQLLITTAGLLRTHFPDRSCDVGPGDLLIHPERLPHAHEVGPDGAEIVTVATTEIDTAVGRTDAFVDGVGVRAVPSALPLARRIQRELTSDEAHVDLALRSLALRLVVEAARSHGDLQASGSTPPEWVGRAKVRLEEDFDDQIRIGVLATQVGVTPMQLIRAFQRHYGISPGAYLRQVRLRHALKLLSGSDRPLAGVALAAGYADQSHLCRVIKEETGLTPGEYRRAHQGE